MSRVFVHKPTEVDIICNLKDNFYLEIEVVDEDCVPFDLTYYTPVMEVRNKWQEFLQFEVDGTVTGVNTFTLERTATQMQELSAFRYLYEIYLERGDEIITIRKGEFVINGF